MVGMTDASSSGRMTGGCCAAAHARTPSTRRYSVARRPSLGGSPRPCFDALGVTLGLGHAPLQLADAGIVRPLQVVAVQVLAVEIARRSLRLEAGERVAGLRAALLRCLQLRV